MKIEDSVEKMKSQVTDREKILQNLYQIKDLYPERSQNSYILIVRKINPKWAKD